jgi:hypothetical protein
MHAELSIPHTRTVTPMPASKSGTPHLVSAKTLPPAFAHMPLARLQTGSADPKDKNALKRSGEVRHY